MTWSGVLGALAAATGFIATYWVAFNYTNWGGNNINGETLQSFLFTLVIWSVPAVAAATAGFGVVGAIDMKLYRRRRRAELAARESAES